MYKIICIFLLISLINSINGNEENNLLGCFTNIPKIRSIFLDNIHFFQQCTHQCTVNYYRYINFYNNSCSCSNFIGEQISNTTCDSYCFQYRENCTAEIVLTNVYQTNILVSGPPNKFQIKNISSNSCRLYWKEPESYVNINSYTVNAIILKTFSKYPPETLEWIYGNNTFQAVLFHLLPATKYNITICAVSDNDGTKGAKAYQTIITKLEAPDSIPHQPEIISNEGNEIKIKINPVLNNNGPLNFYWVIVVNIDDNPGFHEENLFAYEESIKHNISYYICAELRPDELDKTFIVGDGKKYGRFYNPPLNPDLTYKIIIGALSNFNGETKIVYSNSSGFSNGISILNVYDDGNEEDSPAIIVGLSIAIAFLSMLLLMGIILFVLLKNKIIKRRRRFTDNQELTMQGPMIEVENNGYIHDEEHIPAITHYRNLKQKVRTIPINQLKVEPANLLGVGKFGKVNTGTLHEDEMTTVTCYTIHDKKMSTELKKRMLLELDTLIKIGKHDNVIDLIGTAETRELVVVVLEYHTMNLKDFLLGSRDNVKGKFSSLSEMQALSISSGICQGMTHLHSLGIIHKQICARSILISNNHVPKIGGFGLAQYFSHNKIPDYTRWTALEVFKGQIPNVKSDIWSVACVLWEIIALGGTPYGKISSNNDIPDNLNKGIRLPQLKYISDHFYQLLLDCWQIVADERPNFEELVEMLENFKLNSFSAIDFKIYASFQYEQFYPNMELSDRPVF